MTAPPRPEWLWEGDESCVFGWDPAEQRAQGAEVRDYITYLERELESAEAALDRMRERPDPDSWRGP